MWRILHVSCSMFMPRPLLRKPANVAHLAWRRFGSQERAGMKTITVTSWHALARCVLSVLQAVTAGSNPITLKKGIDKTCDYLVKKLREVARPVKGTDDIRVQPLAASLYNCKGAALCCSVCQLRHALRSQEHL